MRGKRKKIITTTQRNKLGTVSKAQAQKKTQTHT